MPCLCFLESKLSLSQCIWNYSYRNLGTHGVQESLLRWGDYTCQHSKAWIVLSVSSVWLILWLVRPLCKFHCRWFLSGFPSLSGSEESWNKLILSKTVLLTKNWMPLRGTHQLVSWNLTMYSCTHRSIFNCWTRTILSFQMTFPWHWIETRRWTRSCAPPTRLVSRYARDFAPRFARIKKFSFNYVTFLQHELRVGTFSVSHEKNPLFLWHWETHAIMIWTNV